MKTRTARRVILRFLALVFYIMEAGETIMYLIEGYRLPDISEWLLLAGQIIMILGLLADKGVIMSAALTALATGLWMKAMTAVKSMVFWGFNVLDVLLLSFFLLSAAMCVCILYTEIAHPSHNGKTVFKLIGCHVVIVGLYCLYQEAIYAAFVGVLPSIVTTPYNIRMTGELNSVILARAGTLMDGLLAITE